MSKRKQFILVMTLLASVVLLVSATVHRTFTEPYPHDINLSNDKGLILTTDGALSWRNEADTGYVTITKDASDRVTTSGGLVSGGAITADGITDTSTEATNIAVGTTGTRPTGTAGDIRYNSTLDQWEVFGSAWKSLFYSDDYLLSDGTAAGQLAYWDGDSWEPITSGLVWDSVGGELQLDNATWLSGADFAGTGTVNALKINTDDQIEVGADVAGLYAIVADSGKDVPIWLGDTAGATSFLLKDSSGATIFEVDSDGMHTNVAESHSIADSEDGNPATDTFAPASSYVELTCNDSDTCDITMSETGMAEGMIVEMINVSANVCDFADSSGVSELAGAFAMGQYDSLTIRYIGDRWVEMSRSDN